MFYKSKTHCLVLSKDFIFSNSNEFLLENINITTYLNNTLLIKGFNGTGKTTLITILNPMFKLLSSITISTYFLMISFIYNPINYIYFLLRYWTKPINYLSFGNKQFLQFIIINLLYNKLIYLDEIFNGLDKNTSSISKKYINLTYLYNKKYILITHNLDYNFLNTTIFLY